MKYMGSEVGTYRCETHGKVDRKVFMVPEPNEAVAARYVCFHCWLHAGEPETLDKVSVYNLGHKEAL